MSKSYILYNLKKYASKNKNNLVFSFTKINFKQIQKNNKLNEHIMKLKQQCT